MKPYMLDGLGFGFSTFAEFKVQCRLVSHVSLKCCDFGTEFNPRGASSRGSATRGSGYSV